MVPGDLITMSRNNSDALWNVPLTELPAWVTGRLSLRMVGIVVCTSGSKEVFIVGSSGCGWSLVDYFEVVR